MKREGTTVPWLEIAFICLGILLLFIEIVLLPGFGAAGVPGIVLILTGLGMVWREFGLRTAFIYAGVTVTVTVPLAIVGLWLAPRTKFGKSLILQASEKNSEGFQASRPELASLVGKSGKSITPLRPAGTALIAGQRVDVVSPGDFIGPNTEVEVIYVEGNRVVVRPL